MSVRRHLLHRLSTCCILAGTVLILAPAAWVLYTGREASDAQTAALAAWDAGAPQKGPAARTGPAPGLLLAIPSLGVRKFVPEGATPEHLRRYGVGRISWTSLPPDPGIVGIAGHRTTYGAPFFHLDRLRAGDRVVLEFGGRRYSYRVERQLTVEPSRADALQDIQGRPGIALVTCSPPYSAALRLIVFGTLEQTAASRDTR